MLPSRWLRVFACTLTVGLSACGARERSASAPREPLPPARQPTQSATVVARPEPKVVDVAPHSPFETPRRRTPPLRASLAQYDRAMLEQHGIQTLSGTHLVLYTDLPAETVQAAPALLDRLYPVLVARFGEPVSGDGTWKVAGHVMGDQQRFRALGLMPADLGDFPAGMSRGNRFWIHDQETDYYRRHLVLHESVHCFMDSALGGRGPAWFAEGNAELLATHRRVDGDVRFGEIPRSKDDVERLGRIEMVHGAVAERRARTLEDVLALPYATYEDDNTAYAWAWALCAFLDGHPRYRERFRSLDRWVLAPDFNGRFRRIYSDDWDELAEAFEVFAANLTYGYDIDRSVVDFHRGQPFDEEPAREVAVASDRGWCNTGLWVEAGRRYRLQSAGRFSLADEPRVWYCEAQGLSYRYVGHKPIGRLVACIRSEHAVERGEKSGMLDVLDVGPDATLVPEKSGTLYLRINDDWGELADNRGELRVRIEGKRGD